MRSLRAGPPRREVRRAAVSKQAQAEHTDGSDDQAENDDHEDSPKCRVTL